MFQKRETYSQILLGVVLLILPFITSPDISSGWALLKIEPFQHSFLRYLLLIVFMYANYNFIIPKFYIKKRWIWLFVILVISYVFISQIPSLILGSPGTPPNFNGEMPPIRSSDMAPINSRPNMPMPRGEMPNRGMNFFSNDGFIFQFLIVFILTLVMRLNSHLREVRSEKLLAEVSYLKAQINPHFLFNTLNNLYALALKKSDQTPDAILKLSGMMRYVVTESNQEKVALKKEINYIEDYIALQKLRLSNSNIFTFNVSGNINREQIAPLILINFIENAFKYGVSSHQESQITIAIHVEDGTLTMQVKNTICRKPKESAISTGEGIANSKKRLEMIYPNAYSLNIQEDSDVFNVILKINVA
ncbi:Histidine kinase [Pustulibacterium marinum]|uniref:Histidine kinase n=1 Tax=Pustulibacterium marinum TaxID=1224947 RepID=A0A1I7GCV0_9FLAO|nr:histidine kinase [Pustulibacterium marinum]SFU46066.1 Histidine kinase [Pustulibacterium marinum]